MAERGPVVKGTFQLHGTRCGKPNCKCAQGALHRTAVLAFTDEGKRRNIYVRPPDRPKVQRSTERYRRFRKRRAEMTKLHGEILRLADELLKELLVPYEPTAGAPRSEDPSGDEHVAFWDVDDIDTLDTYQGKVRVIRAVITKGTKDNATRKTWCLGVVGKRARKVSRRSALRIIRARWHIENTGFCQWVKYWNLGRVYRHTPNAILAILLLWMLVFNFLQLFVYRRLKRPRIPKDPCDTIIGIVAVMFRDVGALTERLSWGVLADAATI